MAETKVLELKLDDMAYGGEAIGRASDGRMAFVAFALPGEKVRIEVVEEHKRWLRGRLIEVLEPASARIEARCKHFVECGGCHYQHMPYEAQLEVKRHILTEQLRRIGGFEDPPVGATVASPDPWNYRNHLRFQLTRNGSLGYVTSTGDRVFEVEECHLPEPPVDELWPLIDVHALEDVQRVGVRAWDWDQRMVILHGLDHPKVEVHTDLPASIAWLSPSGASVLAGEGAMLVEILGRGFQVSAGSFFQVNSLLIDELVLRAMTALELRPDQVVYDLYAGVGLFSAFMAQAGAHVAAVEQSPWACADFEVNLEEFDQVSLYESSVEQALSALDPQPDAVLVDPPRAGLGKSVVQAILDRQPARLVYVSCDPATLARDGGQLALGGYRLESATPVDLFPQTYHIETISLWLK